MKYVNLGDICDILNGYAFKSSQYTNKGCRIIRITNVQKGIIADESPQYYSSEDMIGLKKYELFENDILVSLTGNVGRVAIMDKSLLPAALNQRVACLRLIDSSVYYKYLFHYLNSDMFENMCIENSNGIAQKNLSTLFLNKALIPLPHLETQKRIAEVLDKAQALIDARKEQIRLMDELIQAQFIEIFGDPVTNPKGWEVSKLKNHVNNIESGWSPKCLNSEAPINKWGVLKLSAVTGGQYKDECNKKLPEDVSPRLGLEIKDGDLLLTRKNTPELVGDSCFVFKTRKKLMMPDIVFRIQTKKTLNRLFLWSAFNTNEMKSRIRSLASGSAKSMSNISKAKLYDLEVIVPNIDLQNDFEIRVRKIVSYKELLLKSLSELETYNKGLFKESFISDFLEVHR